jgi:hypothetical protein
VGNLTDSPNYGRLFDTVPNLQNFDLYPELTGPNYYNFGLTNKRLPGGALGQTPVQCDNTRCWPAGEGYIDSEKIAKIDKTGERGTEEHVRIHEGTHENDFVRYPYLMHGIQAYHQDLIQKYGPNIALELYEALTDSRVVQKKNKTDKKKAGNWFNESGYKPWMKFVQLLRKSGDFEDVMKFYNEIGEMRAKAVESYQKPKGPYAGGYPKTPTGKGYCRKCRYN